jgi:hypothetical protein
MPDSSQRSYRLGYCYRLLLTPCGTSRQRIDGSTIGSAPYLVVVIRGSKYVYATPKKEANSGSEVKVLTNNVQKYCKFVSIVVRRFKEWINVTLSMCRVHVIVHRIVPTGEQII